MLPSTISFKERFYGPAALPAVQTLLYTCPSGNGRRISGLYLTQDSNARTVTVWVVPAGQAVANGYKLLDAMSTLANDLRIVVDLDYPLRPGETVYGLSSGTGTNLTITGQVNI